LEKHDSILAAVRSNPGRKAKEIARELRLDTGEVNSVLHGPLKGRVRQDNNYCWWVSESRSTSAPENYTIPTPYEPAHIRLCKYYLDCLSQELAGASVWARSKYDDYDYVPLESEFFATGSLSESLSKPHGRKLIQKVRQDKGRLELFVGYPTRLHKFRSKRGDTFYKIEPVLLFSVDALQNSPGLSADPPNLNHAMLESVAGPDSRVLDEAVQLTEDLGLGGATSPELSELIQKLRNARPEWDWRETSDPSALQQTPDLSECEEPGIYNQAVLICSERSPFTQGLETELSKLSKEPASEFVNTALGRWLSANASAPTPQSKQEELLEIIPLNSEQREAVRKSLVSPLTVVTGPPGTGKSQVVTSILINAAWRGQKVLFASKNNKAVDVVESRVNGLSPRPVLLRVGSNDIRNDLIQYLVSLLGSSVTDEDREAHQYYEARVHSQRKAFLSLEAEALSLVQIRNQVDAAERALEPKRKLLRDESILRYGDFDTENAVTLFQEFHRRLESAQKSKQPFITKLFWAFTKKRRYELLDEQARACRDTFSQLGTECPSQLFDESSIGTWNDILRVALDRLDAVIFAKKYALLLRALTKLRPLEAIGAEHVRLLDALSDDCAEYWKAWTRLQPSRLDAGSRKTIGNYTAILQLLARSDEEGRRIESKTWAQYYALLPKIMGVLSCWAVTSLSARGRVPLAPGFFDLLIIDEASQCDIASALPLLFRAKRAVIIGDPHQLRHIAGLNTWQDNMLLGKHDLTTEHVSWSYSTHSLFDLAASQSGEGEVVFLRDHHRSHASIIGFSNEHFYENRLRVATRYENLRPLSKTEPAVRWLDVKGETLKPAQGGAVNHEEIDAVVTELRRIVLDQNYRGTIGIVSPFRVHVNTIREKIQQDSELSRALLKLEFLADTVHRFQGDERDLMIFSPVVSRNTPSTALGFLKNQGNLFNVAITRARSTLLVIGDRTAAINSGVSYLSAFARYVEGLYEKGAPVQRTLPQGNEYPTVARPERVSSWERVLYTALCKAGLRTIPQYDEEKYTLDFALIDGDRKLNIEVDGEKYHRDWTGDLCRADLLRNQRLIELGWDVMRFWVYEVRDDIDSCMRRVSAWVAKNS